MTSRFSKHVSSSSAAQKVSPPRAFRLATKTSKYLSNTLYSMDQIERPPEPPPRRPTRFDRWRSLPSGMPSPMTRLSPEVELPPKEEVRDLQKLQRYSEFISRNTTAVPTSTTEKPRLPNIVKITRTGKAAVAAERKAAPAVAPVDVRPLDVPVGFKKVTTVVGGGKKGLELRITRLQREDKHERVPAAQPQTAKASAKASEAPVAKSPSLNRQQKAWSDSDHVRAVEPSWPSVDRWAWAGLPKSSTRTNFEIKAALSAQRHAPTKVGLRQRVRDWLSGCVSSGQIDNIAVEPTVDDREPSEHSWILAEPHGDELKLPIFQGPKKSLVNSNPRRGTACQKCPVHHRSHLNPLKVNMPGSAPAADVASEVYDDGTATHDAKMFKKTMDEYIGSNAQTRPARAKAWAVRFKRHEKAQHESAQSDATDNSVNLARWMRAAIRSMGDATVHLWRQFVGPAWDFNFKNDLPKLSAQAQAASCPATVSDDSNTWVYDSETIMSCDSGSSCSSKT